VTDWAFALPRISPAIQADTEMKLNEFTHQFDERASELFIGIFELIWLISLLFLF